MITVSSENDAKNYNIDNKVVFRRIGVLKMAVRTIWKLIDFIILRAIEFEHSDLCLVFNSIFLLTSTFDFKGNII